MASVSIRESIRWLPDEATEPTSTIVLTSPGRRFVDLRVLHQGEVSNRGEDIVPPEQLDWAIAGSSSSVPTPERGPNTTHGQWRHWIDSRTLDVENATDEGDNSPLGRNRTLEKGRMVNPETGLETDYEEIWVDEEPRPVPSDLGKQVVVLDFQGRDESQRGRVVKVGRFCQGLLRDGDAITAERWEWQESKGWWRSKKMGHGDDLPCEKVLRDWDGSEGATFKHDGRTWTVIEAVGLQG